MAKENIPDSKKRKNAVNITYEKCEDYLILNLVHDPELLLENHRRGIYSGLLLSGELKEHLLMIQERIEERFNMLVD